MYAISQLDPEGALRYLPLIPYEARFFVYAMSAVEQVHCVGASLMGQPIGIAVVVEGWAPEGQYDAAPRAGAARLVTLRVAPRYRRMGVAKALLQRMESLLAQRGVDTIDCNFVAPAGGLDAIDALIRSAGWNPRELTMLQCRADHALLSAPVIQEQAHLPPEYEIVDWVDLSDEDRISIRVRQEREPWYPTTLDPFHYEPELEVLNSLALKCNGEVVGWLITRRTSELTMYYRCMFVREDLQKLGRAFALLYEAVSRHAQLVQSAPGYGEWSTPASLRAMCAFIRRRLEPFGTVVTEQYVTRKTLSPAVMPTPPRLVLQDPIAFNAFTREECERATARVLALRNSWQPRDESIEIHTLGTRARDDAFDGRANYLQCASRTNPLLEQQFSWLYSQLHSALQQTLGAPVAQKETWATPVFRIVSDTRGAHLPVAPVHCDMEFTVLQPGVVYEKPAISFSILLSNDDSGAGLTMWELLFEQTVGLDTEETARLLDEMPRRTHELESGRGVLYAANRYHQTTPRFRRGGGAERVTLEGHAIYEDGAWHVYG